MLPTNTASTTQWLAGNTNLRILAYLPSDRPQSFTEILTSRDSSLLTELDDSKAEPIFGSNIREAARIIREWWTAPYGADR